ncbi:hypothetical protein VTI74DRAFT_1989 [Chaetomium olivicolor]
MATNTDRYAAQRRLAAARAARAAATPEEIEARGIRPDVNQILHHMNRVPSHSFKRTRLNDSNVSKIYEDEDDDYDQDEEQDEEREEDEFEDRWQGLLAEEGLQDANMFLLAEFRQIARQRIRMIKKATAKWHALSRPLKMDRFKLIASLCTCTELIVEVCKYVRPVDIVTLYSISKDFHHTINQHMRSSIFAWANHMAPSATRIYSSPVYCRWFIPDPAKRLVTAVDKELSKTQPGQAKVEGQPPLNNVEGQVRLIPGLLWLQMVVNREIRVRDIIATLARNGHRLPPGAHLTLKKIWLVMDAATSQARMMLLNNPDFFTDEDLYIAQMFMVKLVLRFNDPVFGPQSSMLMRLMMGQRGLSPLWALLRGKKYRSMKEIRQLKLRYDVGPDQVAVRTGMPLHGVEIDELGVMHYEGWGTGSDHLLRPDELVPLEAARRQLNFDKCVHEMMIYGHVDFATGNSLVPSLEEMYMSDDELGPAFKDWKPLKHELIHGGCGNVPFDQGMWQPKHARKARWKTLREEEKEMILEAEEEEMQEVKELQSAFVRFEVAAAELQQMAYDFKCTSMGTGVFKLRQPTIEDFKDQLQEFNRPRKLRYASNSSRFGSDRMEIDSESDSPPPRALSSTLPLHTTPQQTLDPDDPSTIPDEDLDLDPISPNELNRILNSFRPSHGPHSASDTEYVEDEDDENEEDYNYNYNQDGDLTTHYQTQPYQTHPQRSFPPINIQVPVYPHHPHQHRQHQGYYNPNLPSQPVTTTPHAAAYTEADETEAADDEYSTNDSESEGEDDASSLTSPPLPPLFAPEPDLVLALTPATALSENTDDMLLAQADLEYSEDEVEDKFGGYAAIAAAAAAVDEGPGVHQGGGNTRLGGGGGNQAGGDGVGGMGARALELDAAVVGAGAGFAASGMDWDEFLRNPAAYAVERGGDDGAEQGRGWMGEDEGAEEEDRTEEEQDGDDGLPPGLLEMLEEEDDDETILDEDMEEEDEEEEELDINALMEQLQVGGLDDQDHYGHGQQQHGGQQQEEEDEEINIDLYIADEDIGEDERTKKLRDWFRPW